MQKFFNSAIHLQSIFEMIWESKLSHGTYKTLRYEWFHLYFLSLTRTHHGVETERACSGLHSHSFQGEQRSPADQVPALEKCELLLRGGRIKEWRKDPLSGTSPFVLAGRDAFHFVSHFCLLGPRKVWLQGYNMLEQAFSFSELQAVLLFSHILQLLEMLMSLGQQPAAVSNWVNFF